MTREEILQVIAGLPEDQLDDVEAAVRRVTRCATDRPTRKRQLPPSVGIGSGPRDLARNADAYLAGMGT